MVVLFALLSVSTRAPCQFWVFPIFPFFILLLRRDRSAGPAGRRLLLLRGVAGRWAGRLLSAGVWRLVVGVEVPSRFVCQSARQSAELFAAREDQRQALDASRTTGNGRQEEERRR